MRADPGDEIAESWDDARPLLLLVLGVSIIANGLLYVVIGRWLRPVERIVAAMDGIEQGDYRARLPAFELPELANVASKFNHMAEVLERSREQNRHLAQQTLAIQEGERRALAHELHDELGQSISAINAVAVSIAQASRGRSRSAGRGRERRGGGRGDDRGDRESPLFRRARDDAPPAPRAARRVRARARARRARRRLE